MMVLNRFNIGFKTNADRVLSPDFRIEWKKLFLENMENVRKLQDRVSALEGQTRPVESNNPVTVGNIRAATNLVDSSPFTSICSFATAFSEDEESILESLDALSVTSADNEDELSILELSASSEPELIDRYFGFGII